MLQLLLFCFATAFLLYPGLIIMLVKKVLFGWPIPICHICCVESPWYLCHLAPCLLAWLAVGRFSFLRISSPIYRPSPFFVVTSPMYRLCKFRCKDLQQPSLITVTTAFWSIIGHDIEFICSSKMKFILLTVAAFPSFYPVFASATFCDHLLSDRPHLNWYYFLNGIEIFHIIDHICKEPLSAGTT